MKRSIIALACVSVSAFAGSSLLAHADTGATSSAAKRLVFTALPSERTETFIPASVNGGKSGKGDDFVEHEVLRDSRGRKVGETAGDCLTVNATDNKLPPTLVRCDFVLRIYGRGQITTEGLVPRSQFRREVLAVTGGTGHFVTARGQVITVLNQAEEHTNTITVDLRGRRRTWQVVS